MGYSDPNNTVRREERINNLTGVASTSVQRLQFLQRGKLKSVAALINTAGTNAAAGFDIFVGTTSVGGITCGTNTAGVTVNTGAINAIIPQNGFVDIRGKANSATLNASLVLEYEVLHDSTNTA
ncbi:MAG: hypothetical protein ACK51V_00620 [bacterium]|jgi:hypothetical protein|nr:hypothetical protein [Betaproteobacteria bacterium]